MNFHHLSVSEFLIKLNELFDWDHRIKRVFQVCGNSLIVACEDNLLRSVTYSNSEWIWLDSYEEEPQEVPQVPDFVRQFVQV
ncbi:hypothetical protein NG799_01725 [Laspinema sp. D1]|uniref:Uncharacterized protein n=1 Tax=Laspinema palackyanum D2a TaxID=2953684 RepID=A0ABT2MJY1_9CYAN|nr:hypothetical protein [Laspinema sp. D3c]MCT7965050.1 hypothetical protein [Laspinema sp. D2a]MCT7992508.1 hypothetical protein [Laspinema sp. D3c]